MPNRVREGHQGVWLDLPADVLVAVRALAAQHERTFRDEVTHALQRHLARHSRTQGQVPKQDGSQKQDVAPKKRGRPKGS